MTQPYVQLQCFQGDCPCGSKGLLSYLAVDCLPVTMPVCPLCFKPLAGKAIARLFRKTKTRKKVGGK